ncbi:MAG: 16S rRNA (uracil1498-N3)-methyltransferase [Glaciecola sp.]|jgi:16S rRNA (uracil1498-N3)-methyltransferase
MQLFFASKSDVQKGVLSPEESQHCVKVLRKKVNDKVNVIDGEGCNYLVRITKSSAKSCEYQVLSKEEVPFNLPNLHIAIAPTKNLSRFEFFVEKACELGIKEITPMLTSNSERKHLNIEKLTKKMIAACKQSYTLHFPTINPVLKFSDVVKIKAEQKLIAHCYSHETPHLKSFDKEKETFLIVGPEGDFSKEEVQAAIDAKFQAVSLGYKRLRTETAGMFACSIFNLADS